MATRIIAVNPGGVLTNVINTVGPTATSAIVAVVVDLASLVTDAGVSRGPDRQEVLDALDLCKQKILQISWPPA